MTQKIQSQTTKNRLHLSFQLAKNLPKLFKIIHVNSDTSLILFFNVNFRVLISVI